MNFLQFCRYYIYILFEKSYIMYLLNMFTAADKVLVFTLLVDKGRCMKMINKFVEESGS